MTIIQLGDRDFLTADLHIGGAPWPYKLWFSKGKANPIDEVRRTVSEQWDYQAGPNSTIVILGDALDMRAENYEDELRWFDKRPGRKILIPGNHDWCHPMHRKPLEELRAAGWMDVFEVLPAQSTYLEIGGDIVPACHYPNSERSQPRWRHENTGVAVPVLHGHTHARKASSRSPEGVLQLNVGWPAWKMLAPVPRIAAELELPWQI